MRPLALTLVLLVACGGIGLPEWKTAPKSGPGVKRVDHLEKYTSTQAWRLSPFSRFDDVLDLPVYLIVAEDHTACITSAVDWTVAEHGDFYPCPRAWRIARPT